MDTHELQEHTEHAHHSGQKAVGLTMAIVAVLLAIATLMGHRTHTEETLALTQNVDEWDYYQAKHSRAYLFALAAEIESLLPNGRDAALNNMKNSADEECEGYTEKPCSSPGLGKSRLLPQLMAGGGETAGEKPNPAESAPKEPQAAAHAKKEPGEAHSKGSKESGSKGEGAKQLQLKATEGQQEVRLLERKADLFDGAELFLEISIVLCSIALLAENKLYWKLSFISTVAGVAVALWGLFLH